MDMNYSNFKEYNDLKSSEEKYNQQKKILKSFTEKWKQQTLKYLNFAAKEQRIPDAYKDVSPLNKLSSNPSYTQYLQRVRAENKIGLNKTNSFNRDKYGQKLPTHQYRLMGDVLQRPSQSAPVSTMYLDKTYGNNQIKPLNKMNELINGYQQKRYTKWKEKPNNQMLSSFEQPSLEIIGGIRLSTNIKHRYGSHVCNELLKDEIAVGETMADIDRKDMREKKAVPMFIQGFTSRRGLNLPRSRGQQLSYLHLSNTLRNNVFPGEGIVYNCGTTHADYNEDVSQVPAQFSEHRRKKIKLNI